MPDNLKKRGPKDRKRQSKQPGEKNTKQNILLDQRKGNLFISPFLS